MVKAMLALLGLTSASGYATCASVFPSYTAANASDVTELQERLSQGGDVCVQLLASVSITTSISLDQSAKTAICAGGRTISIDGARVRTEGEFYLRDAVISMRNRGTADDFNFIRVSGTYDSQNNTYIAPDELLSGSQYKESANIYVTPGPASLSNDVSRGGGTHVRVRSDLASPLSTSSCTFYSPQKAVVLNCASNMNCPDNMREVAEHFDPTSTITYCAKGATRLPNSECQPCIKPLLCGAPPDAAALIPFPGDQCVYEGHVGSNCAAVRRHRRRRG